MAWAQLTVQTSTGATVMLQPNLEKGCTGSELVCGHGDTPNSEKGPEFVCGH